MLPFREYDFDRFCSKLVWFLLLIASGLWGQEEILFLLWYIVRVLAFALHFFQMNVQMKNIMNKFVLQEQYLQ